MHFRIGGIQCESLVDDGGRRLQGSGGDRLTRRFDELRNVTGIQRCAGTLHDLASQVIVGIDQERALGLLQSLFVHPGTKRGVGGGDHLFEPFSAHLCNRGRPARSGTVRRGSGGRSSRFPDDVLAVLVPRL